jgi:hypothetical protein
MRLSAVISRLFSRPNRRATRRDLHAFGLVRVFHRPSLFRFRKLPPSPPAAGKISHSESSL